MTEKKFEYELWDIRDKFTNNLDKIKSDTDLDILDSIFSTFYEMCFFITNRLTYMEEFYNSPSMKRIFLFCSNYEKIAHKSRRLKVESIAKEEQKLKKERDKIQTLFKENAEEILTFLDVFKSVDMNLKMCLLMIEKKIEEIENSIQYEVKNKNNSLLLIKELNKSYKEVNQAVDTLSEHNSILVNKILYTTDLLEYFF